MLRIFVSIITLLYGAQAMAETIESINKGKSIEISGFDCAEKSVHMIKWLGRGSDYRKFVVSDVERELYKQQPGSTLLKLQCTSEPELLTSTLPQNGDESKAIITKFSATFPLKATVSLGGETWVLTINQNYYAENLNIPNEHKVTQNFTVKGSAKQ